MDNTFSQSSKATVGVDFKMRQVSVDDSNVNLQIWDTAGQERFKALVPSFYKGMHGCILAYDVNNRESFNAIEGWISELEKYSQPGLTLSLMRNGSSIPVFLLLVGNKSDIDNRKVKKEEG